MRTAPLVLGVAVVAWTSPALGLPVFPGMIQDWVAKKTRNPPDCAVPCILCHKGQPPSSDNVRQEGFIVNLRARPTPIRKDDPAGLVFALDARGNRACAENPLSNPCDSDGDGTPDIAELIAGSDPDGSRNFDNCPKYGCGASMIATAPPLNRKLGALGVLAALGIVAVARRASSARAAGARRASAAGRG